MITKNLATIAGLFFLGTSVTYSAAANLQIKNPKMYFGLQVGPMSSKIKKVTYENPRNPAFSSALSKSNRAFNSILLGAKHDVLPIRIELEFMQNGDSKFQRIYNGTNPANPFIGYNEITVKSQTNLLTLYADWHMTRLFAINLNVGTGLTTNKGSAEQIANFTAGLGLAPQGTFFPRSKTNITTAFGAGISKQFKLVDVSLGYRYIHKGNFSTGLFKWLLDETFRGSLSSHHFQAGIRYFFK
jgi:opacity protein-like surface antigen